MNHSLLFVGCGDGLSDPNFKPFLSWLRGVNAHNQAHHYRPRRGTPLQPLGVESRKARLAEQALRDTAENFGSARRSP
ncbi:MAG: hypothetical protein KJ072_10920 [Verrucomicrobia bacterium]|nr:hypothetical protein [Verrucomicrobiota bacterium]